jgi:hypothetical protein
MQAFIARIGRLPEEDRSAVCVAIWSETLDAISEAPILGWLPAELNLECTRAVAAHLGRRRANAFFRDLVLGATDTPLLHGLVRSALRVSSADPGMYLPWIIKGWELVFRDCGKMSLKRRGSDGIVGELAGVPPVLLEDRQWIDSVSSSVGALGDLVDCDAEVYASEVDQKARVARFVGSWTRRPKVAAR